MRIDKYLKLTRLIKRRTIAKELLERGIFKISNKVAKPSSEVNVGDILILPLGRHELKVEVLNIVDYCKKVDASSLYKIVEDKIIEEKDEN